MDRRAHGRVRDFFGRLYVRTGFRGPVVTLLSGGALSLVLTYGAQLVLTRLYTPEAFGVSDYFVMMVTVLLALVSLRYEDAVMVPESEEEASRIVLFAMGLALAASLPLLAFALWSEPITRFLGIPELAPWFWLIPVALLITKASRLLEVWHGRQKKFRRITGAQVAAAGSMGAGRIGAAVALPGLGAGGLIGGFIVGQAASAAVLAPSAVRVNISKPAAGTTSLLAIARRYRRFAAYSAPAAALNAAFARLPTLMLPLFFPTAIVGFYGRAFVALAVPLGLIGNAVAQVFFVHAGEARRAGTIRSLTTQVHARLVMIGLMPSAAVMVAGPDLFAVVFGEPWRFSGTFMPYVAPWMFLTAVSAPLTRIFDVLERQGTDLASSVGMFALQAVALIAGGITGDLVLTLLLLGIAGAVARALHIVLILRYADVPLQEMLRPYARYGAYTFPPLLLIAVATLWGTPVMTLLVTGLGVSGYYLVIAVREGILPTERGGGGNQNDLPAKFDAEALD